MLEPCEGRLSSTVLRGLGGSNAPWLPDSRRFSTAPRALELLGWQWWFPASAQRLNQTVGAALVATGDTITYIYVLSGAV